MKPDPTQELKDKTVELLLTHRKPPDIDVIESVLKMASAEIRFLYENNVTYFRDEKDGGSYRYRFRRQVEK